MKCSETHGTKICNCKQVQHNVVLMISSIMSFALNLKSVEELNLQAFFGLEEILFLYGLQLFD
jgi:hypothetical protein